MEDVTAIKPVASSLVLRSLETGIEYPISGETLVGREVECGIALPAGHISRYHAKLIVTPKGVFVEDLHSSNGTYINGQRISNRQPVSLGDEIRFHKTAFRLTSLYSGEEDATIIETPMGQEKISATELSRILEGYQPEPTDPSIPDPSADEPLSAGSEPGNTSTRMLSSDQLQKLADRSKAHQREIHDVGEGPRLVVLTAPLRGKVFPLPNLGADSLWTIGRSPEREIQLTDKTISADHARLAKTANGWFLSATHAKNGIIVNGSATNRAFLCENDRIRLGRTELCFKIGRDEQNALPESTLVDQQITRTRNLMIGTTIALFAISLGLVILV